MAHDVNQSEMEVATQVRTALVARISHERYELWMPEDCRWQYGSGTLTLLMPTSFLGTLPSACCTMMCDYAPPSRG